MKVGRAQSAAWRLGWRNGGGDVRQWRSQPSQQRGRGACAAEERSGLWVGQISGSSRAQSSRCFSGTLVRSFFWFGIMNRESGMGLTVSGRIRRARLRAVQGLQLHAGGARPCAKTMPDVRISIAIPRFSAIDSNGLYRAPYRPIPVPCQRLFRRRHSPTVSRERTQTRQKV